MLDLNNLLWVLPGITFVYIFNHRRPSRSITLSGWPYVFSLVFFATCIWIPIQNFFEQSFVTDCFGLWSNFVLALTSMAVSALAAFFFTLNKEFSGYFIPSSYDNFIDSCISLEKNIVIVSLKNNKIYVGILFRYPENPKLNYESQSISIIPLISGGRCNNTKEVRWGTFYPATKKDNSSSIIIIPRKEIITFGKFNPKVFGYFYKEN